ncbi:hypothetical protein OB955_03740 [Halobacteria archaeon AArc-m2/3/4]|uniref:Uncharacterized protein n=1 Tax=Natronoglomus mannanivorans TaxID=2979990 RepID=A0ABT2QA89_9EURY|nr:hypothetical protein [Halobacteria archaeon AArc-m2/3/4]
MPGELIEYDDAVWKIDTMNAEIARLYPAAGNPGAPVVVARDAIVPVSGGEEEW